MRAKILHKFFKNSDLNRRNNQHLTIQKKNLLWLHWYAKVTFYFATHFYSILLCPEGFLIFLHSTPSWYQYFCINPTFSMLLVTLLLHWSHHRVHFTHCILNIPFPFFWNTPCHLFCISNSAKVRKVIITQTSQPNLLKDVQYYM